MKCPYCTGEFEPNAKNRRSIAAHNRYFAMIAAAYHHWPETHRLQPLCAEDVRTFLQMRAGWGYPIHNETTGETYLMPKSIAIRSMDQAEFYELSDRISNTILPAEIGVDGETLLQKQSEVA